MRLLVFALLLLFCSSTAWSQTGSCGVRIAKSDGAAKRSIIGGNEVPVGRWPWQVLLKSYFEDGSGLITNCGGSIIADRWILTAAHCLDPDLRGPEIIYGCVNKYEYSSDKIARPKNYTIHEEYQNEGEDGLVNDVALIELDERLTFDNTASPICLPSINATISEDAQVMATGFGQANDRDQIWSFPRPNKLLETMFPLIPNDVCRERGWKKLRDTNICGGSFGHGTGSGDSGGPVFTNSKSDKWFQIGVTSYGWTDDVKVIHQDILPGVYARVAKYCDWIEKHTRGEVKCQDAELIDARS